MNNNPPCRLDKQKIDWLLIGIFDSKFERDRLKLIAFSLPLVLNFSTSKHFLF